MAENDPLPGLDPSKIPQRVFISQLFFSIFIGAVGFFAFCYLRPRYPQIYSLRTLRRNDLDALPNSWFQWIVTLCRIKEEEILAVSGLDAYVFLCFFRISIQIFGVLTLISVLIIGPIRYYVTGHYDHQDDIVLDSGNSTIASAILPYSSGDYDDVNDDRPRFKLPPIVGDQFPSYLWVYAVFTYVFVSLSLHYLLKMTRKIITIRQSYLGSQNSITDKTIKLNGIPSNLRDETSLKNHIEQLGIGKVIEINFNRDWEVLDCFMKERNSIIKNLERYYITYLGIDTNIHKGKIPQSSLSILPQFADDPSANEAESRNSQSSHLLSSDENKKANRPKLRLGWLGFFGPRVDAINYYLIQLKNIDKDIMQLRQRSNFKPLNSAFVTMDSVASAQMIAQAVLDPKVHHLLASLAPSPSDVIWENFSISATKRFVQNYLITILFVITSVALIFPVSSLAALINIETISKLWPSLGRFIAESKWLTTFVTGILPPTLFTLLNVCIPYFYSYLSTKQYFYSNGDVELASVSKNFFYTFFNLFLVFTIAGSAANYWSYFTDTTKIAYQLANSIKKLSLFYSNLILLQGIGLLPYKLLQFGDAFIIGYYKFLHVFFKAKVGIRKLRYLYYSPKIFDFGLILPQHILIFVITIIYSIISTKLLSSGLIYFILGYFVYKYQLIYSMIHPQHSTGKVWAIIIHRLILGLVLFELTMIGTLALENAVILAVSLIPLIGATIWFYYRFEKYYKPLLHFIALRSIKEKKRYRDLDATPEIPVIDNDDYDFDENNRINSADISTSTDVVEISSIETSETAAVLANVQQSLRKRRSTFDEYKDVNRNYVYPYLTLRLLGPWVGFEGNFVETVNYEECSLLKDVNEDVRIDVSTVDANKIWDKINDKYAGEVVESSKLRFSEWE